jgi:hypothetical protein
LKGFWGDLSVAIHTFIDVNTYKRIVCAEDIPDTGDCTCGVLLEGISYLIKR